MATLKDVKRNMENLRVYLARELETANQIHAKSDEYHPAILVAGNNLTEVGVNCERVTRGLRYTFTYRSEN